jgi:hypothetical protein
VTGNDAVGTPSYGVPLTLNGGTADVLTQLAYLGAITLNGGDLTSDQVTPNPARLVDLPRRRQCHR